MAKSQGDLRYRKARAKAKPYKIADRDGLYLYVSTTGARSWRFDYRHAGKRQTLTIGLFPDVPLIAARADLERARSILAKGENPAVLKQREKQDAGDTFKALGEAWYGDVVMKRSLSWQRYARRELKRAYAYIGTTRIREVGPPAVLAMLRGTEKKVRPSVAESCRKVVSLVFDYAMRNLRAESNPARNFRDAIERPDAVGHPHIQAREIPAFLKSINEDAGPQLNKLAVHILFRTFVRKCELVKMKWAELDLDGGKWEIPAERMKGRIAHLVPLVPQVVELFKQLKPLAGGSEYVFPNCFDPKKPMHENTLNTVFHRVGYKGKLTPHGIRATASTALNESGFRVDVIERQLSHVERDQVRAAYNRADYLAERRELMAHWASLIDSLCAGGNVVPIKAKVAA